ncbi:glycohydrolase toxin TNT-related protein [Actinomadura sp. 21ATH]|uniref:glycohydrolase toxin TNT-related protein n=1 Tax=Actinomadura sp. 21ATH TaxID=1735444 RepID=UPI0035BF09A6
MALSPEEVETRLRAVVDVVTPLMPRNWRRGRLRYFALGSFECAMVFAKGPDDGWALPRSGAVEMLRDLRRDCHDPERGVWPGVTLALTAAGEWSAEPEGLEDFWWRDEVTPADCVLELSRFPRPGRQVPPWMRALLDLQRAADDFDPAEVLARPRAEDGLVEGRPDYFAQARESLEGLLPGGGDRILAGRLEEGRWSVVPAGEAWLAVLYAGGRCERVRPFAGAKEAFAHAASHVMAAARVPVDSGLMRTAGLLTRHARPGVDAWDLDEAGVRAAQLTAASPRPEAGDASPHDGPGTGSYVALAPLRNRPEEHFTCEIGPPPEEGPFIAVRRIHEFALLRELPALIQRPPAPPASTASTPSPPPAAAAGPEPVLVLPAGTEVDAYGHHDQRLVFAVGTPDDVRGRVFRDGDAAYHLYRVDRPLPAAPARFAPFPALGDAEAAERARTGEGQGYLLGADIGDLVRSGHLSEIGGTGGAPPRPPGPRYIERRRTNLMAPQPPDAPSVQQRPVPYDGERHAELEQRLGRILLQIAPPGWARIDLRVRMTVAVSEVALAVVLEDGGHAEVEPPRDLAAIAAELRSMMYRPDEGTWFGMRFTMDPPSEYWAGYNGEFDPGWTPPLAAADWRHDLSVFPRSDEHVPRWLRDRLEAGDGGR